MDSTKWKEILQYLPHLMNFKHHQQQVLLFKRYVSPSAHEITLRIFWWDRFIFRENDLHSEEMRMVTNVLILSFPSFSAILVTVFLWSRSADKDRFWLFLVILSPGNGKIILLYCAFFVLAIPKI